MKLTGLHILLTYRCTYECDHCFVWGSPRQRGTLTEKQVGEVLAQARDAGVEWIYFEGGEPFLFYGLLLKAVQSAARLGFRVGIVSNAYWANSVEDAQVWLAPMAGLVEDLTLSSDLFHGEDSASEQAHNASAAARRLGIPTGLISIAQPGITEAPQSRGKIGEQGAVMYRGRAARTLAARATLHSWEGFTGCPYEDLREPGRLHLDPLGNLHICQGIVLGNLFRTPLKQLCAEHQPDAHPICGPLLAGGPAALVSEFRLPLQGAYADACHLCYEARLKLRGRFPGILEPDQMYGASNDRQ